MPMMGGMNMPTTGAPTAMHMGGAGNTMGGMTMPTTGAPTAMHMGGMGKMPGMMGGMHMPMPAADPGAFCVGSTVMYMDGFVWGFGPTNMCIALFFPEWTLDSTAKYVVALVGVVLLGITSECMRPLRLHARAVQTAAKPTSCLHALPVDSALHVLQLFLGYALMLAVMTYHIPLGLATLLGVGIGHGLCKRISRALGKPEAVNTEMPCCADLGDVTFGATAKPAKSYGSTGAGGATLEQGLLGAYEPPVMINNVLSLQVGGMTCAACARRLERVIGMVSGVTMVAVSFATTSATVHGDCAREQVIEAVENTGMSATAPSGGARRTSQGSDA